MGVAILMPALSPTMTEGKLARWLKAEGDQVKSGDVIAEIETDKATMEVEAVDEGTLTKILVPEGTENVAVNSPIAEMDGGAGEAKPAAAAPPAAPRNEPYKSHLAYVKERRTDEEGDALLAEALERVADRRRPH